jgi:hypothetical protein
LALSPTTTSARQLQKDNSAPETVGQSNLLIAKMTSMSGASCTSVVRHSQPRGCESRVREQTRPLASQTNGDRALEVGIVLKVREWARRTDYSTLREQRSGEAFFEGVMRWAVVSVAFSKVCAGAAGKATRLRQQHLPMQI